MQVRNAFCAIRPPGHHAGPTGIVTCANDPNGSHGFCILSNIAIAAAYAMNAHRHAGELHFLCWSTQAGSMRSHAQLQSLLVMLGVFLLATLLSAGTCANSLWTSNNTGKLACKPFGSLLLQEKN